jgi:hypothetical protein
MGGKSRIVMHAEVLPDRQMACLRTLAPVAAGR